MKFILSTTKCSLFVYIIWLIYIYMHVCMYIHHKVLNYVATGGLSDYDFAVANEAVLSMLSLSMCICK